MLRSLMCVFSGALKFYYCSFTSVFTCTHCYVGRRKLLQCLLDVRRILNSSEPYYVMNNLYITDYCVWIQRASSRQIQNLAIELKQVNNRELLYPPCENIS